MPRFDKDDWLEKGKTYSPEDTAGPQYRCQEVVLMSVLSTIQFETVLEVGCGFGRIARLVVETFRPQYYLATDVSRDMLNHAHEYCTGTFIDTEILDLDDPVPNERAEFAELVICSEVLMHRRPETIQSDVEKLMKLAEFYVVTIDWWQPGVVDTEGNYQHPYDRLFPEHVKVDIPEIRQAIRLISL